MAKKVIIIMLGFFFTQLMVSCICNCGTPGVYEVEYSGAFITPMNTAGFYTEPVTDTVYKNSFGLYMGLDFEMVQTAMVSNNNFTGFGFAQAFSCSCDGDEYGYPDPLSTMDLFVINTKTEERINVTSWFGVYGYDGILPFDEFFKQREDWHDGFQVELVEFDSIPNSAIFVVEAHLESGLIFTKETSVVNFYD